jgi:ribosomal protein S18 acetylase RimI-like enzyme
MIVRQRDDDEYANVPWPSGLSGNEVSTVHLVAVHPSLRGKGVGAELVREAIRLSRAWCKRAVHLDVMLGNLAASRIYTAEGFAYVGNSEVFYEDTGTVELEMYELVL